MVSNLESCRTLPWGLLLPQLTTDERLLRQLPALEHCRYQLAITSCNWHGPCSHLCQNVTFAGHKCKKKLVDTYTAVKTHAKKHIVEEVNVDCSISWGFVTVHSPRHDLHTSTSIFTHPACLPSPRFVVVVVEEKTKLHTSSGKLIASLSTTLLRPKCADRTLLRLLAGDVILTWVKWARM